MVCFVLYLQLLCQLISDEDGQAGKEWSQEHTDVSNVNSDVDQMKNIVEDCRCHHQTLPQQTHS